MLMSSDYEIWLTYDNETQKVHFPVNPEELHISNGSNDESYTISGLGDIVLKQDRQAIEISFESVLPAAYFPGMNFNYIWNPYTIASKITDWKNGDMPCHFIVTGTPINLYCVITQFDIWEVGGDVGSVHYSIVLTEFRPIGIRQIDITNNGEAEVSEGEPRVDNHVQPSTYTVVPGDSLWIIARKVLGDGARWKEIYDLNRDKIKNPDLIYEGQIFEMPG